LVRRRVPLPAALLCRPTLMIIRPSVERAIGRSAGCERRRLEAAAGRRLRWFGDAQRSVQPRIERGAGAENFGNQVAVRFAWWQKRSAELHPYQLTHLLSA
jgi:hypothetical protein